MLGLDPELSSSSMVGEAMSIGVALSRPSISLVSMSRHEFLELLPLRRGDGVRHNRSISACSVNSGNEPPYSGVDIGVAGNEDLNTALAGGCLIMFSPSHDSMCNFFKCRKYPQNMLL